jgi:hypothetical protein
MQPSVMGGQWMSAASRQDFFCVLTQGCIVLGLAFLFFMSFSVFVSGLITVSNGPSLIENIG